MTTTPDLGIPELAQSQSTPEITHNEALVLLQALLNGVINDSTSTPPGSPVEGDSYIVASSPSGAWSGYENHIAIYWDGGWRFVPGVDDNGSIIPMGSRQEGLRVYVRDTDETKIWTGSPPSWESFISTSRLTVNSNLGIVRSGDSQVLFFQGGSGPAAANLEMYGGTAGLPGWTILDSDVIILRASNGANQRLSVTDTGIVAGSAIGGAQGAGTINAQGVYDDGVLLTCYVFEQALDDKIVFEKWDEKVPDRVHVNTPKNLKAATPRIETRSHAPARKFAGRIGSRHDPLTLDGYARHWKEKRHLTSMPNEAGFDPENEPLSTGEWIQRLIETVEIQAVLIEELHTRIKTLEAMRRLTRSN